jgi:putative intracellular protease/amidase
MKILMVLTSHDELGNTGRKTGFWLEELAAPYFVFKDSGAEITLASPKGGLPRSIRRATSPAFEPTSPVASRPMWPRTHNSPPRCASIAFGKKTTTPSSIQAATGRCGISPKTRTRSACWNPLWRRQNLRGRLPLYGALRYVRTPAGKALVEGKTVNGFTNGEEEEVGLTKVVPFLVEDEVMSLGATFSKVKNWGVHTVADGQLITGQNPASSGPAARLLLEILGKPAN